MLVFFVIIFPFYQFKKDLENSNLFYFQNKFLEEIADKANSKRLIELYTLSGRKINSFANIKSNDFTLILSINV